MRDALGGLVNIVIIIVFLVIVSGYLAFNVNYTKAFRVKNKIISAIEQYEGNCNTDQGACSKAITDYMKSIGYSVPQTINLQDQGYICPRNAGYCIKEINAENNTDPAIVLENNEGKVYYQVVTVIYIDIPIINRIMPNLKMFQVTGTTKVFKPSKNVG